MYQRKKSFHIICGICSQERSTHLKRTSQDYRISLGIQVSPPPEFTLWRADVIMPGKLICLIWWSACRRKDLQHNPDYVVKRHFRFYKVQYRHLIYRNNYNIFFEFVKCLNQKDLYILVYRANLKDFYKDYRYFWHKHATPTTT